MKKAYAIGTTMTVTMNGETREWTKTDSETWNYAGGTEGTAWVSFERADMARELKRVSKEIDRLAPKARTGDEDAIWEYDAAMDELDRVMEDLRLMDRFFPELAK